MIHHSAHDTTRVAEIAQAHAFEALCSSLSSTSAVWYDLTWWSPAMLHVRTFVIAAAATTTTITIVYCYIEL